MAEKKIQARIRQKVDTKANWDKATNFVPLKGEYIYYSDLHKVKVGDGTTKVGSLPFLADSDTHSITGMYIGATNAKANAATTNGNTYLKLYDDNTKRAEFLIQGSGATSIASNANGNITISSTDSHFTTGLYVGKVDEKSNSATTNGNTYLKLFDNDTKRAQHLINGGGATMVTSNASGTIEIATPIKNLDTTSGSGLGDGRSENIAGSGTIYLHKVAKTGKLTDLSERTFSNISSRGEEYLEWGGPAKSGEVSPIGVAMSLEHSANRLALINHDALTFEYSSDGGTTWTAYSYKGKEKTKFCTSYLGLPIGRPDESTNLIANKSKTRITITAQTGTAGYVYVSLRKLLVNVASATTLSMLLEKRTGANYKSNGVWETIGTYNLTGWSGWNDIPLSSHLGGGNTQTSNYWQMRMTITCTTVSTTNPKTGQVRGIRIFGENCWIPASTLAETGHLYSYNMDGHATFPGNVYANGFYANGTISTTNGSVSGLSFIEGGKKLSEKYLDKGSTSTNNNQVVYNPVEMKKALTVPSVTVSDIKNAAMVSTDANGKLTKSNLPAAFEQISVIDKTIQYNDNIEVTEVYLSCEGMEDHYAWDRLVFSAPGSPAASNIKYYYNYMGQKTELTPTNASALNSSIASSGESIAVAINRNESNPTITYLPNGLVLGGGYYSNKEGGTVFTYYVYDAPQGYMPAIREIAPDTSTFFDKGTSSTVVNQVVYNPVEMKKALTVPSIQTTPIQYSPTDYGSAVSLGYTTINGITKAQIQLACPGLGYTYITQTDNEFAISATTKLSCNNNGGWTIAGSKIITEATLGSAVGSISSESIVSICI